MTSGPNETQASLLVRLQDTDDQAAWEEFAGLYGPVVFQAARRRGLQLADADNVVQEVLLAVAQSIGPWLERSDRGRFRPWLLRIARNEAYDLIHERATRTLGKDGSEGEGLLEAMADGDGLSASLDEEYQRAVFSKAIRSVQEQVADHTWQAFWLTRVEGLTVEEAAERLKIRPGNIYFARSRVLARITEFVRQHEAEFK